MIGTYGILTKASKGSKSALVRNVDVVKQESCQKLQSCCKNGPIDGGNPGIAYRVSMLALAIAIDWAGIEILS